MKVASCFFPSAVVGVALLGLLVLGIPVSGFTQTPHTCKSTLSGHQPINLGGVTSFPFTWARKCTVDSGAINWTIYVYNIADLTNPVCTYGPMDVPDQAFIYQATCNGLNKGSGYQVRVSIQFERTPGSPMGHTENFLNP
jgi:hypothetical protein